MIRSPFVGRPDRPWFWLLLLSLVSIQVAATTVDVPSFAELAQKADRVIHGKVLSQRSFWDSHEGQRFIRTEVEFEVYDRSGARNVVDHVTLRFMGGRVDEMIMNVAGMPTFTLGEEVVLFERGNGHTICPLVGWRHGHYRISRRGDGSRPIVRRADFSLLRETAEVSRPFGQKQAQMNALSRGEEALSLGDFLAEVTALRTKGGARE